MTNEKYINGRKYYRYCYRNMWIEYDYACSRVYSYDTFIGLLDWQKKVFKTWGYGRYSSTTSKQITMLCHELDLLRVDIEKPDMLKD